MPSISRPVKLIQGLSNEYESAPTSPSIALVIGHVTCGASIIRILHTQVVFNNYNKKNNCASLGYNHVCKETLRTHKGQKSGFRTNLPNLRTDRLINSQVENTFQRARFA